MLVKDRGSTFEVHVSAGEVETWNRRWPCSSLVGRQRFEFEKATGDLVDRDGEGDGSEALALSEDAQRFGEKKLGLKPTR